jgi:hypothetical protein
MHLLLTAEIREHGTVPAFGFQLGSTRIASMALAIPRIWFGGLNFSSIGHCIHRVLPGGVLASVVLPGLFVFEPTVFSILFAFPAGIGHKHGKYYY